MKALHAVVLLAAVFFATGCAALGRPGEDRPVVIQPIPAPMPPEGSPDAPPEGSVVGVDLGSDRWNRLFELGLAALTAFLVTNKVRDSKAKKASKPT